MRAARVTDVVYVVLRLKRRDTTLANAILQSVGEYDVRAHRSLQLLRIVRRFDL